MFPRRVVQLSPTNKLTEYNVYVPLKYDYLVRYGMKRYNGMKNNSGFRVCQKKKKNKTRSIIYAAT